jgi:hypothetical protein
MRADKLLMLGVGALGAYAVFRMMKAEGKAAPLQEPLHQDASVRQAPDSTLRLKSGSMYGLRLELGDLPPFDVGAGVDQIAHALSQLGFAVVNVSKTPPPSAPPEAAQGVSEATRFVTVRWTTNSVSVSRPRTISLLWEMA